MPAVLIALAAAAGFVAHEPLLIVLGHRGPRRQREDGARAWRWLLVSAGIAGAAAAAAAAATPRSAMWSFAVPLIPLAVVAVAVATRREKTGVGENAVAIAFASVAIPMCVSAGAPLQAAVTLASVFATLFIAGTLGVRVVILRVRGGGDPQAVRQTRRALFVLAGLALLAFAAGAGRWVSWAAMLAVAPGLVTAMTVAVRPPPPTRLKRVGWTLVSTSAFAAIVLIAVVGRWR